MISFEKVLLFFSDNRAIEAAANLFGIIAGLVLTYAFAKILIGAVKAIYANRIRTFFRSFRRMTFRFALVSAGDIHVFVARSLILISGMIFSAAGIIMAAISAVLQTDEYMMERFQSQKNFQDFGSFIAFHEIFNAAFNFSLILLTFVLFITTMRLSSDVRQIRRRWRLRGRL